MIQCLPRRKLMNSFHIFHNFLQRLFIFDVHLITYFPFPIPIVDHIGQLLTGRRSAPPIGGSVYRIEPSNPVWPNCEEKSQQERVWSGRGRCKAPVVALVHRSSTVTCAVRNAVVAVRGRKEVWRRRGRSCALWAVTIT